MVTIAVALDSEAEPFADLQTCKETSECFKQPHPVEFSVVEPTAEAEMFVAIIDFILILQIGFRVQQLRSVG